MFRLIKMIDPNAFVSQSSVIGVYGEGFDEMRVKIKEVKKKMKIVFATNNANKLMEVRKILGNSFEVLSLKDINCNEDIPEKGQTLEDNAILKAEYVYKKYHINCFADDTGLEVEALGGAPGVYSARYASMGEEHAQSHDSGANMTRLLRELEQKDNRKARFRTIIALMIDGNITTFEGIVNGEIIRERRGGEGFGYDPIFQPEGYSETFAELGTGIKNQISHRARATQKLANYLKKLKA
jgi:non-canonical purine NTP pyrophosphatase (RdgB/HAM1 family)